MVIGEKIQQRLQGDTFDSLLIGDVFIIDDCVHMKIESKVHVNAVNLQNGSVDKIPSCAYVEKINCVIDEV